MFIPGSIDQLTVAWLRDAFIEGRIVDGHPDTIVVEPLGAAAGLLGDLARIHIKYAVGTGPTSVIVKLPASDPGGHRVGSMLRAWPREVAFYQQVAPLALGARVPVCYHTAGDERTDRWVVIMEDCPSDTIGSEDGASTEQAGAAVDALAGFHAAWWESPTVFPWMPGVEGEGFAMLEGSWAANIPRFIDRYKAVLPAEAVDWVTAFTPTLGTWSRRTASEPLTIVHADYRLDNLLFDGPRVTMIDWQTALRGSGAMDLSCFCATGLSTGLRRNIENNLIDRYLAGLEAAGVVVDHEWFRRSYDEHLLWWMGQFANNLAHLAPDDPAIQQALETMAVRTYTAAVDRNVGRLLS